MWQSFTKLTIIAEGPGDQQSRASQTLMGIALICGPYENHRFLSINSRVGLAFLTSSRRSYHCCFMAHSWVARSWRTRSLILPHILPQWCLSVIAAHIGGVSLLLPTSLLGKSGGPHTKRNFVYGSSSNKERGWDWVSLGETPCFTLTTYCVPDYSSLFDLELSKDKDLT